MIIQPTYSDVRPFCDGLAAVNLGAKWVRPGISTGGKWGYVDASGQVAIPIQFDFASDFSHGLARVSNYGSSGVTFIDRQGHIQIRIADGTAGDFREGLAPVYHDRSTDGQDWETRYIDTSGDTEFEVGGYGEEFHEGLAVLIVRGGKASSNENKSYGFIDRSGRTAIEPRFGEASHFSDGLAAVRTEKTTVYGMGDSWGYVGKDGEFQIDPIYNEARPFQNGRAAVHEGGELVHVLDAPCYWEGGTWWTIDKTGKRIGRIKP